MSTQPDVRLFKMLTTWLSYIVSRSNAAGSVCSSVVGEG